MAMERLAYVLRQTGDVRDEAFADGIDALRKIRGKDMSIASYLGLEKLVEPFIETRIGRKTMPLYEKTAMSIRDKILLGEYTSMLPSENKLLESYANISRGTLREALRMLREEGLISSEQGRGNFVLYERRKEASGLSEKSESLPVK